MPKPDGTIGVAERKELRNYIDGQYSEVEMAIREQAGEEIRKREKDIRENPHKSVTDLQKKAEKLRKKAQDLQTEVNDFMAQATADGFSLNVDGYEKVKFINVSINPVVKWSTKVDEERINFARQEVQNQLNDAMRAVRIQRNDAEKALLLAGLQQGVATDFLNNIPSASEVFSGAKAKQLTTKAS